MAVNKNHLREVREVEARMGLKKYEEGEKTEVAIHVHDLSSTILKAKSSENLRVVLF